MAGELNFEKIASLRPDLILGMTSVMSGGDYEKLAKIAPTVADSKKYPDFSTPWQELARTAGQALGEADRAEKLTPAPGCARWSQGSGSSSLKRFST